MFATVLVRKQISHIIFSKLSLKDATNWWLRYMLSQPVHLDLAAVIYLLRYYTGVETFQLVRKFLLNRYVQERKRVDVSTRKNGTV